MAPRRTLAVASDRAPELATDEQEYPKVVYRKSRTTSKTPNGYEARTVTSAEAQEALGSSWKESPEDL